MTIARTLAFGVALMGSVSLAALAISGAKAGPKAKAKAKPADHCIPKSACKCQWETLDGKKQYVCRVIRAPR